MSKEILERILADRIVAIVRGIPAAQIIGLAEALEKGGIHCVEVTFDQTRPDENEETLAAISAMRTKLAGRILPGAGTVMSTEQVRLAVEAGAEFIISPNADEAVIRETKRLGKISIPGAMTPSEIASAYAWGADLVKVFPAGCLGTAYIKAVKAPLRHIPLVAVGGVNPENCASFLAAGCAGVACGGNLVSAKLISEGRFDEITATAAAYIAALHA